MLLTLLVGLATAQETPHTTAQRPVLLLAEASLGGPMGIMGGRVGYKSWEVGGGIGATGYKVGAMWKHYWTPFDNEILSFPVGVGPSVGLSGAAFGIERDWEVDDVPDVLFTSWVNGEISAEWRARWGGVWRWTVGGAVRALQNQVALCEDVEVPEYPDANTCYPLGGLPSGPIASRLPVHPYIGFGYGYAF